MKNSIVKYLMVMTLFTTFLSFGNTQFNFSSESNKIITKVDFKSVSEGSKLSIIDANGTIYYNESIVMSGDYSRGFDLTNLPNGLYFFELTSDLKIVTVPFNVTNSKVNFKKNEEKVIFKTYVRVKENHVYVSRPSFRKGSMSYKIYFQENNTLIINEIFKENTDMKKIYNFSNMPKGEYLFVFKDNGREYTRTVRI